MLGRYDLTACGDTGDCRTADKIVEGAGHSLNTGIHAGTFYRTAFTWLARLGIRG